VTSANYVACHKSTYVKKYDLTKPLKEGGIFILNSKWNTVKDFEKNVPAKLLRDIAKKNI